MSKNKNRFLLDCPVCREPALPAQKADGIGGVPGLRFIHPGRIASCFIERNSDAAQNVRARLDEWFGGAYTDASPQALTDEISTLTEWSTSHFIAARYEGKTFVAQELARWENEGGYTSYQD